MNELEQTLEKCIEETECAVKNLEERSVGLSDGLANVYGALIHISYFKAVAYYLKRLQKLETGENK